MDNNYSTRTILSMAQPLIHNSLALLRYAEFRIVSNRDIAEHCGCM